LREFDEFEVHEKTFPNYFLQYISIFMKFVIFFR
jgi:hypothetical protein